MSVCGIDPGRPPKTVFAHSGQGEPGARPFGQWWTQREPPTSLYEVVAAERPKARARQRINPEGLIVPAGWGMAGLFAVGLVPGGIRCWIPVEDWKGKLFGSGFWSAEKSVFCANIVQAFSLVGLDPKDEKDQDVIDSIGIAEAAARFTRKELRKWEVRF